MARMKTFFIYALIIVGFYLLSNLLIEVGLNSRYKDIQRTDNLTQVGIYQAEATKVNGRIRGTITNSEPEELNGKYVKIEFFSKRNVSLGNKYIEVISLKEKETAPFEIFFKLKDVATYNVSIVNEKDPETEIELIPKDLTKQEIIVATFLTAMMFW